MPAPKVFSGFTATTAENLLLDAGAFFKDFVVGTDDFDSAVTAGKLLGATQGGGSFSAVPTVRNILIDGVKGSAKGLQQIDEWVVTITANIKEISQKAITNALGATTVVDGPTGYKKITANNYLQLTDYTTNIVWVGKLSKTDTPVVIVVKNAISLGGLSLNMADKAEGLITTTFTGHYDATDLDSPPFEIYYPKGEPVYGSISGAVTDTGTEVEGATVSVLVGNHAISTTTNELGEYVLENVLAGKYTVLAVKGEKSAIELEVTVVADAETTDVDLAIA